MTCLDMKFAAKWPKFRKYLWTRLTLIVLPLLFLTLHAAAPGQYISETEYWSNEPLRLIFGAFVPLTLFSLLNLWSIKRETISAKITDTLLSVLPLVILLYSISTFSNQFWSAYWIAPALAIPFLWKAISFLDKKGNEKGWLPTFGGVGLYIGLAVAVYASPVEFPQFLGSITVLVLGLGFAAYFIGLVAKSPLAFSVLVCLLVVATTTEKQRHDIATYNVDAPQSIANADGYIEVRHVGLRDSFVEWIKSRGDLETYRNSKLPYPVIIATSEGGGIYAAAQAYFTLAGLQRRCPNFSQHLFAQVGVSGGAVGNLIFQAAHRSEMKNGALAKCSALQNPIKLGPLNSDFLSPVLATLLFVEPIDAILPLGFLTYDRASVLALALENELGDNG